MRIFLTGATGFIGSHILPRLIDAGHQVLGLTRSDAGAAQLAAAGAEVHRGNLDDPDTLRRGAERADAVIHCAFDHDFSRFAENCEKDQRNIAAIGAALAGSRRPLVLTSGTGLGSRTPGAIATEDYFDADNPNPRKSSEQAGQALRDVNVSYVRVPQVHDTRKQGVITYLVEIYRAKRQVGYVGDGAARLAAAHVTDVARVFQLAVERGEPGARYHAVAEEGVAMRDIAAAIGRALGLPVTSIPEAEAPAFFGWMAMFANLDVPASSEVTRRILGWAPTGPSLLADLAQLAP